MAFSGCLDFGWFHRILKPTSLVIAVGSPRCCSLTGGQRSACFFVLQHCRDVMLLGWPFLVFDSYVSGMGGLRIP